MDYFVRQIAPPRGWTAEQTASILARTLDELIKSGVARRDVEAIIVREAGRVGPAHDAGPEVGDVVEMHGHEVRIVVNEIHDDQPERDQGVWMVTDEYGETHRIEREGVDEPWFVVIPAI